MFDIRTTGSTSNTDADCRLSHALMSYFFDGCFVHPFLQMKKNDPEFCVCPESGIGPHQIPIRHNHDAGLTSFFNDDKRQQERKHKHEHTNNEM